MDVRERRVGQDGPGSSAGSLQIGCMSFSSLFLTNFLASFFFFCSLFSVASNFPGMEERQVTIARQTWDDFSLEGARHGTRWMAGIALVYVNTTKIRSVSCDDE